LFKYFVPKKATLSQNTFIDSARGRHTIPA